MQTSVHAITQQQTAFCLVNMVGAKSTQSTVGSCGCTMVEAGHGAMFEHMEREHERINSFETSVQTCRSTMAQSKFVSHSPTVD